MKNPDTWIWSNPDEQYKSRHQTVMTKNNNNLRLNKSKNQNRPWPPLQRRRLHERGWAEDSGGGRLKTLNYSSTIHENKQTQQLKKGVNEDKKDREQMREMGSCVD